MKTNTRKIVRIAVFTAIALVLHLVESAIPPLFAFAPNVKLGLANYASLIALVSDGFASGGAVLIIRCVLGAVFAGNITGLLYSLPAAIISYAVQALLVKLLAGKISVISISLCGAVIFNTVQAIVAGIITATNLSLLIVYYLPAGLIAGAFVGVCAFLTLKFLPQSLFLDEQPRSGENEEENELN